MKALADSPGLNSDTPAENDGTCETVPLLCQRVSAARRQEAEALRRELGDALEKESLALEFAEMVLMPALAGQGFAGEATLVRPPAWSPPEDARITVRASPEFSDLVASRIVHERLAIQDLEQLAAETRRMLDLAIANLLSPIVLSFVLGFAQRIENEGHRISCPR